MRLIDPIELKRSIVASNIIGDGKTLEELIDEQPDAQPGVPDTNVGDTISRQEALDALWRTSYIAAEDRQISVTAIKALPNFSTTCQLDCISRQAAIDAVCMEWCNVKHQDCKHPFDAGKDDYYWCDGCETVLQTLPDLPSAHVPDTNVGDMINRQAAIDALDKRFDSIPMEQTTEIMLLRKDLRNLPAAQPQRMKAHWVDITNEESIDYEYKCSKCGFHLFLWSDLTNYCPNCGARMDGGEQNDG